MPKTKITTAQAVRLYAALYPRPDYTAAQLESLIGADRGDLCRAHIVNHWAGRGEARRFLRLWCKVARITDPCEVWGLSDRQMVAAYNRADAASVGFAFWDDSATDPRYGGFMPYTQQQAKTFQLR
jgi:hypothetical protein